MACGICGESGHSRRICSLASSSSSYSTSYCPSSNAVAPPPKLVRCKNVGGKAPDQTRLNGHTLLQKLSAFTCQTVTEREHTSGTTSSSATCSDAGHNNKICNTGRVSTTYIPNPVTTRGETSKAVAGGSCGEKGHYRCSSGYGKILKVVEDTCQLPENITCYSSGGMGHNTNICATLRNSYSLDLKWMKRDAKQRFDEGPTKADGPGWIYLYTTSNQQGKRGARRFKIGRSSRRPLERRIPAVERNGTTEDDHDILLFSIEVPFHKLAEAVIHRQLKHFRTTPRGADTTDGKTECFTGQTGYFRSTVKRAVSAIHGSSFL